MLGRHRRQWINIRPALICINVSFLLDITLICRPISRPECPPITIWFSVVNTSDPRMTRLQILNTGELYFNKQTAILIILQHHISSGEFISKHAKYGLALIIGLIIFLKVTHAQTHPIKRQKVDLCYNITCIVCTVVTHVSHFMHGNCKTMF